MTTQCSEVLLPEIHDVIIVGAGPCGLAVAARLRERTPSALFTDEEHDRYHWINKYGNQASIKSRKTGKIRRADSGIGSRPVHESPSMLVLDSSGDCWMAQWNRLFAELEIKHLRSPMFFHPDPRDRDGLLAYAHAQGRECECIEIANCVGKERSKHFAKKMRKKRDGNAPAKPPVTIDERDRKDYFAPTSTLFRDYCVWTAERYGLCESKLVQKATVQSIDYSIVPVIDAAKEIFTIRTNQGTHYAHSVVLAVGAGNKPSIPAPFPQQGSPCACHVFLPKQLDGVTKTMNLKNANVLVVGGGLTSAQVVDRAIRQGARKVWLLIRSSMKVKPFDVDLSWMGKFKNHEKASFWSADTDEERSEMIKTARGGGSITPRFHKILLQHEASGKAVIHCNTVVTEQHFDKTCKEWTVKTEPAVADLPQFHAVYFATGVQSNIEGLPFMQPILAKHPIKCLGGLPALTDDLMWTADIPLFVSGRFAALRLGPGAGNLEGARAGAERIAWALEGVLGKEDRPSMRSADDDHDVLVGEDAHHQRRYQMGLGSRYEALSIEA